MNLIVTYIVFFLSVIMVFCNGLLFLTLKNKTKTDKVLNIYLFAAAFEALLCFCIYQLLPDSNYFVSHIYHFIHFSFLSYFFYLVIEKQSIRKFIQYAYLIVYVIIACTFLINPKSFFGFNLFEIVLICVLLIGYAFTQIFQTLSSEKKYFYFSIGLIIYFSVSCLIYISGSFDKLLVFSNDPYIDHWIIKDLFYIVFQLFIFKEFLYLKKKQNESSK